MPEVDRLIVEYKYVHTKLFRENIDTVKFTFKTIIVNTEKILFYYVFELFILIV